MAEYITDTPRVDALENIDAPDATSAFIHMTRLARQLERELAEARKERDRWKTQYWAMCDRYDALDLKIEDARKDAERYRWLANRVLACDYGDNDSRSQQVGWRICGVWRDGKPLMFGPSIDAAIDAAMNSP